MPEAGRSKKEKDISYGRRDRVRNRNKQLAKKKEKLEKLRLELLEKERQKRVLSEAKEKADGVFLSKHVKALFTNFTHVQEFLRDQSLLPQTESEEIASKWCEDLIRADSSLQGIDPKELHCGSRQLEFIAYLEALVEIVTKDVEAKGGLTQLELFELLKNNSNHPGGEQALYTWVKKHFREADIDKNGILSCAECLAILHKHKDVFQSLHVNCDFLVRKMRAPMKRLADTKTELANLNQS